MRIHLHTFLHMYVQHTQIRLLVYEHKHKHVHIRMRTYIRIRICVKTYKRSHLHMHTLTYIHTYTAGVQHGRLNPLSCVCVRGWVRACVCVCVCARYLAYEHVRGWMYAWVYDIPWRRHAGVRLNYIDVYMARNVCVGLNNIHVCTTPSAGVTAWDTRSMHLHT